MSIWRLTVRHGPRVERRSFDELGDALAAMERAADRVRREGPLEQVSMVRKFGPDERVAARLELSTGRWHRSRDAGVDVMGDGSLVPFAGGIRRRPLEPAGDESAFEALRRELSG